MQVEILDKIMGSGKSYAALRYIETLVNNSNEEKWIFCTEFLSEISSRTTEEGCLAKDKWRTPSNEDGTKVQNFIELLQESDVQLIAITHKLFLEATQNSTARSLLTKHKYKMFLDETVTVFNPYTGMTTGDFRWHCEQGRISIDSNNHGKVSWLDQSIKPFSSVYTDTDDLDYEYTEKLSVDRFVMDQNRVYAALDGKRVSLVSIVDPLSFTCFDRVILGTYQFKGTILDAYFRMFKINTTPCSCIETKFTTKKEDIKSLIELVNEYNRKFNRLNLSSKWYDGADQEQFKLISNTIRSIGDKYGAKGKPEIVGYTLPKKYLGSQRGGGVQPKGYPHTICLVDETGRSIDGTKDKAKSGHIPCTSRASNEYQDKQIMIHIYNRYPQLIVSNYLDHYEIEYSKELFALNELVQWIWRSAIRNRKNIKLAVLSKRMREIFERWLDS